MPSWAMRATTAHWVLVSTASVTTTDSVVASAMRSKCGCPFEAST